MNVLRKLLFPFVPIYYVVVWLRNRLYDLGLKKAVTFELPVLAVGNLSVGGTGKSPMVEYLVRLLKDENELAVLSRGYKRETKGFKLVEANAEVKDVGDEPLQFKKKFPRVKVAVDADRCNGIVRLQEKAPVPEVVLLDDAYQHRKVKAGFYVLLTTYSNLYVDDIVLPTGDLREPRSGAKRADVVVVTKCPKDLSVEERNKISKKLKLRPGQDLYFATIDYSKSIFAESEENSIDKLKGVHFTLVTGIANPRPLLVYYESLGLTFDHLNFPDHHNFTDKELERLKQCEFIVTTEKDYVRLVKDIAHPNLWYQPIVMKFIDKSRAFDDRILEYIKK